MLLTDIKAMYINSKSVQKMYLGTDEIWPGNLYFFESFTFTNGTQTGTTGPSLANLLSEYDTTTYDWLDSTDNFNCTDGIQLWTVPVSGTYRIIAYGAEGAPNPAARGSNPGGKGAKMQGDFSLTKGEKICILVGQQGITGGTYGGGAGGGTFVIKDVTGTPDEDDILVIAGGGGGAGGTSANVNDYGKDAVTGTSGTTDSRDVGTVATDGDGGPGGTSSYPGGGGGGFSGDGTDGNSQSLAGGGESYTNGATGGVQGNPTWAAPRPEGGFGGGGAGDVSGGGGGGYSGGCGGGQNANYPGGGGGGSYNNGTNQSNTAGNNTGHGKVEIELL